MDALIDTALVEARGLSKHFSTGGRIVRAVDDILATPGLDGLMIGPADLAASSGPGDPSLEVSTAQVDAAIRRAGKLRMDIVGTPAAASAAFADGAQLVVYNGAHVLMTRLRELTAPRR